MEEKSPNRASVFAKHQNQNFHKRIILVTNFGPNVTAVEAKRVVQSKSESSFYYNKNISFNYTF